MYERDQLAFKNVYEARLGREIWLQYWQKGERLKAIVMLATFDHYDFQKLLIIEREDFEGRKVGGYGDDEEDEDSEIPFSHEGSEIWNSRELSHFARPPRLKSNDSQDNTQSFSENSEPASREDEPSWQKIKTQRSKAVGTLGRQAAASSRYPMFSFEATLSSPRMVTNSPIPSADSLLSDDSDTAGVEHNRFDPEISGTIRDSSGGAVLKNDLFGIYSNGSRALTSVDEDFREDSLVETP